MAATLYLLPNRIAETDFSDVLPEKSLAVLRRTRRFLAENARSARRFLKHCTRTLSLRWRPM